MDTTIRRVPASTTLRAVNPIPPTPTDGQPADAPPRAASVPLSPGQLTKLVGPAWILAIVWAVMPALVSIAMFVYINPIANWLKAQGSAGVWVFAAAFMVCTGLGLLPTYAQSILAGYAFGLVPGSLAAVLGFAGGSALGYTVARLIGGDRAMASIDANPKARVVRDALVGDRGVETRSAAVRWLRTTGIVALVRLPPNSPFAVTNLVMASVKVPLSSFVVGTVLGMAPRTVLAVFIGSIIAGALTDEAMTNATPKWVIWAAGGALLVTVVVIGSIANRALRRLGTPAWQNAE